MSATACGSSVTQSASRATPHTGRDAPPPPVANGAALSLERRVALAACAATPRASDGSTCVADNIFRLPDQSDGNALFVVRTLPFGDCNGRTYCTPAADPDVPAGSPQPVLDHYYEADPTSARELNLDEGCVPLHYVRVRIDDGGQPQARNIARLCETMSPAGSAVEFRIHENGNVLLLRQSAASWFNHEVVTATLYPFRILRRETSGSSRLYLSANDSSEWNYPQGVGATSHTSEYCASHVSEFLTIPRVEHSIAWADVERLGSCAAALRDASHMSTPNDDPDAPRAVQNENQLIVEAALPATLELTHIEPISDRAPSSDSEDCRPEAIVSTLRYAISRDARVQRLPGGTPRLAESVRVSGSAIASGRARLVVEHRSFPGGDPASTSVGQFHVRIGNHGTFAPIDATQLASRDSSLPTHAVACRIENGRLEYVDRGDCELNAECTLNSPP